MEECPPRRDARWSRSSLVRALGEAVEDLPPAVGLGVRRPDGLAVDRPAAVLDDQHLLHLRALDAIEGARVGAPIAGHGTHGNRTKHVMAQGSLECRSLFQSPPNAGMIQTDVIG